MTVCPVRTCLYPCAHKCWRCHEVSSFSVSSGRRRTLAVCPARPASIFAHLHCGDSAARRARARLGRRMCRTAPDRPLGLVAATDGSKGRSVTVTKELRLGPC